MSTPRKQLTVPADKVTPIAADLLPEILRDAKPMAMSADEILVYKPKPDDDKLIQAFRINILTGERRLLPAFIPHREVSLVVDHRKLKCIPLLHNQCAFITATGFLYIIDNVTDNLVTELPLPGISDKPRYARIHEAIISDDKKTLCIAIMYPDYCETTLDVVSNKINSHAMELYFIIDLQSKRIITIEEKFVAFNRTVFQFAGSNTLALISNFVHKYEGAQNTTDPLTLSLIHFNFNNTEPSYSRQEIPIPPVYRPAWSPFNFSTWSRNLLPPGMLQNFYLWNDLMVIDFNHFDHRRIRNHRVLYLYKLNAHDATLTYIKEIARGCAIHWRLDFLPVSNVVLFWNQEGSAMQFNFRTRECESIPALNREPKTDDTFNLIQMADDRVLFCNNIIKLVELSSVTAERTFRYKSLVDRIDIATSNTLPRALAELVTAYLPIQDYPLTFFRTVVPSSAHNASLPAPRGAAAGPSVSAGKLGVGL